jgi:hypothetical protein
MATSPRRFDYERILALHADGMDAKVIASQIGASPRTVADIIYNHGAMVRDDMSGDRCICGLRLPCNNCIFVRQ